MLIALVLAVLAAGPLVSPSQMRAQDKSASAPGREDWLAVAPGRVEPRSGEIKLSTTVPSRIAAILVGPNDKVFAGEALLRLDNDDLRTKIEMLEAQVTLRKRLRETGGGRGAERRRVEDALGEAEQSVVAAQTALDSAAAARRTANGNEADLDTLQTELKRAHERFTQAKAELVKVDNDTALPLPTTADGELRKARFELTQALQALDKLTIRAPTAGTILQINARAGEIAPLAALPLIVLGDVSALRVRAEVEERDLGSVKVGSNVVVRAQAFRGREITGTISFVSPIVEPGKIGTRGQSGRTDVNAAEVLIDLSEAGPLLVGMKVDVYFR